MFQDNGNYFAFDWMPTDFILSGGYNGEIFSVSSGGCGDCNGGVGGCEESWYFRLKLPLK